MQWLGKVDSMDKIFLYEMEFYGYHGVFPEETRLGQRFVVDLVVELDLQEAGQKDDLTKTVNYGEIYERVKEIVEGEPKKLIETIAERIAASLLIFSDKIDRCHVKVTKPNPPIPGHYKSVGVEITRSKDE
jgi:dihydroneopterin aldolase